MCWLPPKSYTAFRQHTQTRLINGSGSGRVRVVPDLYLLTQWGTRPVPVYPRVLKVGSYTQIRFTSGSRPVYPDRKQKNSFSSNMENMKEKKEWISMNFYPSLKVYVGSNEKMPENWFSSKISFHNSLNFITWKIAFQNPSKIRNVLPSQKRRIFSF